MRRLLVLAAALACILPLPLSAQQATLRGRVLDPSHAPVVSARVSARQHPSTAPTSTTTDDRGEFTLNVPPGTYVLMITADGFPTAAQPVTVDARGNSAHDYMLAVAGVAEVVTVAAPQGYRVPSVTSATRTPTPLRDVPQSVAVVSSAVIADQRMTGMADVVRYMPGVGIAQGEGNRDTPVLRGNSTTSDFFVDGIRDDVQYFRDVYNVDRVEAVKGPNAMIFGRGGAGGVINRVSRQAEWGQQRELAFQFGSWDNRRLTADLGKGLNGSVAARVTAMYENSDSYRQGAGIERYGINPTLAVRLGSSTMLRAGYEHFADERVADRGVPSLGGRPLATGTSVFFGDPDRSPSSATANVFSSALEHRFSSRLTVRNRVSAGHYDKFYQNVFPGAVDATATRVSISAYNNATKRQNVFNQTDVILTVRTGRVQHSVLAGAELGRQVTENYRSTGFFPSHAGGVTSVLVPLSSPIVSLPLEFRQSATDADNRGIATTAAVYVQDQVALLARLQAVAGVRVESFDMDFRNNRTGGTVAASNRLISPRAGLIYRPMPPVSLYASYTRSYLPRAGEQLSSLSPTNRALEPETFQNYEVGAKWDALPSLGVTAAAYRLNRGNVAVPDPVDPTRTVLVDAQRTGGVELGVEGSVTRALSVVGGYAYQSGEITQSISAAAQKGAVLAQLPKHSFSLWTKYGITNRWSAAAGVVRRGRMFTSTDNLVALPGFTRVDAALFYDVRPGARVQVNVENLFGEHYFAYAHSNNNITPGSPRAVRATLTTRF